ncbi:MAG: ATP-binding cassette domain-containing protein [Luteitalea sp.]|nr:ATP-binding cassette domain-containing protein [Luteitalea sp.]
MIASAPAIETIGLGRDYGRTRALDALDLTVDRGTLVGILGPNGAGKTTAMLLLATLLRPSRGRAIIFGRDSVGERAAVRRHLGLVFQEASIDGLLTVEENLRFAAGLMGLGGPVAQRAVAATLERMGLVAKASQPARQLSGGWRRLTDIARATVHAPDLLILDEPTVGLDPEHRDRIWTLLDTERRDRGTTILFSTHYLTEAESCDRVILLAHGRVVAADTPPALMGAIGSEVVEIEGAGAEDAARALQAVSTECLTVKTDRGYRIGITGAHGDLARTVGATPRITRFAIRPVTLEDVYFAKTGGTEGRPTDAATFTGKTG